MVDQKGKGLTPGLQAATSSNIPGTLNKPAAFQGAQQPRRTGDGSNHSADNILNLRHPGLDDDPTI
jgi:hypothetical protein